MFYDFFSSASTPTPIIASPMSVPIEDTVATATAQAVKEEAALLSTVNNLLVVLNERLQDRPHGQFTLLQLPDIFLIKSQLEQVVELKAKEAKHQETLVQMAMDREEEGIKGARKRVKITGTQSAAIRQAVVEEVDNKTADSQRHIANLEDRLKKSEKMLEAASNKIDRLGDKVGVLRSDVNKVSKSSREDEFQSVQGLVEPLKAIIETAEDKAKEMKLLQDDCNHWRERTQNLISIYDRADSAEVEGLKNQLEELKAEKERLEAGQAFMQEQIDGFEARLEEEKSTVHAAQQWRIDTIKKQAKDQDTKRKYAIARFTREQETVQTALDTANSELEETKIKLDVCKSQQQEQDTCSWGYNGGARESGWGGGARESGWGGGARESGWGGEARESGWGGGARDGGW